MERDGWFFVQAPQQRRRRENIRAPIGLVNEAPEIMAKPLNTRAGLQFTLQVACHGQFERDGRRFVEAAQILDADRSVLRDLGRVDWADLDHKGDVLWAWAGKLWRLPRAKRVAAFADTPPHLLADFNAMRFGAIAPPCAAQQWPR
jgi:hypothetical protein